MKNVKNSEKWAVSREQGHYYNDIFFQSEVLMPPDWHLQLYYSFYHFLLHLNHVSCFDMRHFAATQDNVGIVSRVMMQI